MDPIPRSDADLVEAVRDGDRSAVCALYERHRAVVRGAVATRVRDPQLIDDVVQEAFTRALERLPALRRPERFRSWLLTIARNTANDRWRLERRQVGVDPATLTSLRDLTPGPDDTVGTRALVDLVGRGLLRLTDRDATALALVTHLGLSPGEVAGVLGVSPGAAKVAVHRARTRLRAALALDLLGDGDGLACAGGDGARIPRTEAERHVTGCSACLGAAHRHLTGQAA